MIYNIDYHIIDRCNLNCQACNHFCPLIPATDECKSIEQITADLMLLSKLKNEFISLSILGGEPTLHPELSKILRIARQIFPSNEIHLITNGTKYNKFNQWKDAIIENNIEVYISVYPYCSDYKDRLKVIERTLLPEIQVNYDHTSTECGFGYGFLTNKEGTVSHDELIKCNRPFRCAQLKNGKLYLCNIAAQFDRLKVYFGDNITFDLDGNEYLDLNGNVTAEDLYNFVYNRIPNICLHCIDVKNDKHCEWGVSNKDINEFVEA